MFQTAQWAQSSQAVQSLQQMAPRGATRDPRLRVLVRERQDLVMEWQQRDRSRRTAVAQASEKRDRHAEAINVARLADIDKWIADIDKRLTVDFPDYAALASPSPLSVEDLQAQLGSDEVLVQILDTPEWQPTPEETFIWVVTKTGMRWVKSELGAKALSERVTAPCAAGWTRRNGPASRGRRAVASCSRSPSPRRRNRCHFRLHRA
jgi:hypothetical protein